MADARPLRGEPENQKENVRRQRLKGKSGEESEGPIRWVRNMVRPYDLMGSVEVLNIDSWWNPQVGDRSGAVLELVLLSISDDYESLEIVVGSINKGEEDWGPDSWKAKEAIPVSRPEVIKALRELTCEGFAQAYVLDAREPQARPVEFQESELDDLWFYITPKGIRAIEKLYERYSGTD